MKEELLKRLLEYIPANEDIALNVYGGYSIIHIDILHRGKPVLYTTVSLDDETKPVMKLCSFDEICSETQKDILIISELENICKVHNIKQIYGRAKILKDKETSKKFYNKIGYNFDFRPREKSYPSAIISKEI